jgi:uncharacterized protein (TIGR02246 family)
MNGSRSRIAFVLAFALVLGLAGSAGAADDLEGIKAQCKAFVAAFNAHDAKGMAAVFAEDGDMLDAAGRMHKGRAAIEKALAADHGASGPLREAKLLVKDEPVRVLTADVAISDALVQVDGAYGPDGTKGDSATLWVHNVWKKTGDKWLLVSSRAHLQHAS